MSSSAGRARGADGRPVDPGRLPELEPMDQQRLRARQQEAAELEALMARVAAGDEDAFGTLYDRTSARVYGLLVRILGSADDAATLVEGVFVEAWQQARRYHPVEDGPVFAWIISIAHRRAIEQSRAAAAEQAASRRAVAVDPSPGIDEVWAVIEQRFGSKRVRAGLRALSQTQRQALLLTYFEGYSQQQVARHLDVPYGTVHAEMRDGLVHLRRALGADDD